MNNTEEDTPIVGGGGDKGRNGDMKNMSIIVAVFLTTLPLVLVGTYLVVDEYRHQTQSALERRGAVADLGAMFVHEKLDGVVDIGMLFASRARVYQNIEKGDWPQALEAIKETLVSLPQIDTIALLNKDGVLKAISVDTPGIIGKSFAERDYYIGVSRKWEPYVSNAFKRAAEPHHNIISVAVPIFSSDNAVVGVLALGVNLDTITGWNKSINVGSYGIVFIVDKKGQLIAHNHLKPEDDIIDYSSVPSVQKILKGERGVEVLFNPIDKEERLTAYSPVEKFGFGVVVAQPTSIAFDERRRQITTQGAIWVFIIFAVGLSRYYILRSRDVLKKQRDRERIMLESIGDGIVAIDRAWKIVLWNKSASVITGWSKEEALGKPFREIIKFIRESDRKENISFIEDAIVMKKTASMDDGMFLVKKDGSEVSVGDSAAPVVGLNGEVEGAIVVFRDTSKERESTHLRSDFMYASHQLRTPITEALWNLEIGIEEQDADKKNEDLRVAHKSLLSVKKLSEHLVSVSEIDQGNIAVKQSSVKLVDVLADVQGRLEAEAIMRGVVVSITPVSPLISIATDKKLITKTLFEVIENAVTYSHRDGTVIVTATQKDKEFLFEVTDTGVGIPEQEQVLIFTKFFRASNRGSENPGDGLGLYLAKAYVSLIGGKIWFESVEGQGTTFFISIPIE